MTQLALASIQEVWRRTKGQSWQPATPKSENVTALVHGGWAKRVGTKLVWTQAAKAYFDLKSQQDDREVFEI